MAVLFVMVGGAFGSLARYLLALGAQGALAGTAWARFPLATLLVNVVGSFLLSFLAWFGLHGTLSPTARVALGTGFLGALTTFSTFELESDLLLRDGFGGMAALSVAGNLVLGYGAILLGRALALRLTGAS